VAKLACQEALSPKHAKYTHEKFSNFKYYGSDFFIAIVYNVKHGIEIFTKTLKIILDEKINVERSHNISELFDLLKKEIKKHKIVEGIKKEHLKNQEDPDLKWAYENKLSIDDLLNDLEEIINKYYYCEIIKEKINNDFSIEDTDNTTFRYPENSLKIKLDYKKIIEKIEEDDVRKTLEDIEQLLEKFNVLGALFTVYKEYAKK